ncbi:hypothetical protein TVAG_062650 [Trichomonas vaginalis G3]|uniref:RRM domain-containing protein n=1 Tax=Trichomonas vaginalis (strain ATCC PRA-98 / G3) TaxID=412133 RepID=A2DLM7_TRIV3|nr:RNA-binding domain, RBD family-containing protein [Trichomonas vaginalis G3]EAY18660.1 hypothetical protein TVAG_062650 [Trichomonas vaginalis G3]KAI5522545.1 RNA-binding domain, RBD family-containing protein [Trichomonas vaginalis G3]|eukprot:XP_001579646.1 hypothetical protein [Trichomonas vaginalis G3]
MSKQDTRVIFVGCLRPKTTEEDLTKAFSTVGKVEDVMILRDENGKSKQVAFISYETPEIAKLAVEKYDQTLQCNTIVHVELRKTRSPKNEQSDDDQYHRTETEQSSSSNSSSSEDEKPKKRKHSHHRHHKHHHRRHRHSSSSKSGSEDSNSEADKGKHRSHRHHHHHHSRSNHSSE